MTVMILAAPQLKLKFQNKRNQKKLSLLFFMPFIDFILIF